MNCLFYSENLNEERQSPKYKIKFIYVDTNKIIMRQKLIIFSFFLFFFKSLFKVDLIYLRKRLYVSENE